MLMPGPARRSTLRRFALALLAVLGTTALAPHAIADADAAKKKKRTVSARLATFDRCTALLQYARTSALAHDEIVPVAYPSSGGPVGGGPMTGAPEATTAPAPAAAPTDSGGSATKDVDFSGTNNQEAGVDEPDVVKTDGRRIFTLAGGRLHALTVDKDGKPTLRGSLTLTGVDGASYGYGSELLLQGDRLLVLGTQYGYSAYDSYAAEAGPRRARAASIAYYPYRSSAVIAEVDVSDPTAMKVARSMTVDGRYVSARATGDTARVVITTPPQAIAVDSSGTTTQEEFTARKRTAIAAAPLSTFRPQVAIFSGGKETLRGLLPCTAIRHPRTFSGLDTTTVLTIDLEKGLPAVDADAVLGAGDTVYASTSGLYVASQRYDERFETMGAPSFPTITTQIHRFSAGERLTTSYRASGSVPGYLLNQFSLSDFRGVLRVATTEEPVSFGDEGTESSSALTVLDESDGRLLPVGRVGGLGKGERIYAVRFVDDVGYVVTFRQTDPLYTIDLSNPRAPKVLGELKILGYSAYLHPVGDNLLLGIGQDATPEGRRRGTQVSLFDVSDLRAPKVLRQAKVGGSGSSSVEYDHKAFLWWAPKKTAVLPVTLYDSGPTPAPAASAAQSTTEPSPGVAPAPTQPFTGIYGYRVDRADGIKDLGRLSDPKDEQYGYVPQINRTLVFGGRLVTISERGLGVASLDTFERSNYVTFPLDPTPADGGTGTPKPAR